MWAIRGWPINSLLIKLYLWKSWRRKACVSRCLFTSNIDLVLAIYLTPKNSLMAAYPRQAVTCQKFPSDLCVSHARSLSLGCFHACAWPSKMAARERLTLGEVAQNNADCRVSEWVLCEASGVFPIAASPTDTRSYLLIVRCLTAVCRLPLEVLQRLEALRKRGLTLSFQGMIAAAGSVVTIPCSRIRTWSLRQA